MWQPASFPSSLFPFPRGSLQAPKWRILLKFQYYLEKPIRDDGLQFALDCKLDFDLFEKQQVCVSLGVCFHWMSGVCVCAAQDSLLDGQPIWALVYYCLRCGDKKAAQQVIDKVR